MGFLKYFPITAGILTGMLVLIVAAHVFGLTLGNKKIVQSCQGDYVKYDSSNTYCLSVVKQLRPLGSSYNIMIFPKGDEDNSKFLSYIEPNPASEEDIRNMRVIWNTDGIELTCVSGIKLYIPQKLFVDNEGN